jgi:S-adenosylmethionine decarboxylase
MIVGTEWLVDATGCRAAVLRDLPLLERVCKRVIAELNLQLVSEMLWHQFPGPGGVTGLALLSESHLACHTYPEYGVVTFNLYCCRARPEWPWAERLSEMLGAREVKVQAVERLSVADLFPQLENQFQLALAKES